MTIGVYGIFDTLTDQCYYIGQSVNIEGRWQNHKNSLLNGTHSQKRFAEHFEKELELDLDRLRFEILTIIETRDHRALNEAEVKFFERYKPLFFGQKPSLGNNYLIATEVSLREAGRKIGENAKKTMVSSAKVNGSWIYRKRCLQCSTEFESKGPTAAYCSVKCKTAYSRVDLTCQDCGKTFSAKSSRTKWCNYCKYRQKSWTISCVVCNTEVVTKHPDSKYCSSKCKDLIGKAKKAALRASLPPKTIECEGCKKTIVKHSYSQRFCSESCKVVTSGAKCKGCGTALTRRGQALCSECAIPIWQKVDPNLLESLYRELGVSGARARLGMSKSSFYRSLNHFGVARNIGR